MATTGEKIWKNTLKVLGSFFGDLPNWFHVLWISGVALLIFWQSGWDYMYLLKVALGVLWGFCALIIVLVIVKKTQAKNKKK